MGQYHVVWQQLKRDKKVSLASPRHYHKRIIKAIKKEKYKDHEFKFMLSEAGKIATLGSYLEGPKIHFYLKIEFIALKLNEL